MAGKMLDGTGENWDLRTIRAYAEGVEARQLATSPTNPHTSGTPEFTAWALGVSDCTTGSGAVEMCVANPTGAKKT